MRGRRPERPDPRFTFHASRFTDSCEWTENDADGRGSFAAVERSMSDRLLDSGGPVGAKVEPRCRVLCFRRRTRIQSCNPSRR